MKYDIPMPGEIFNREEIVVASCYYNDDITCLLLLNPNRPGQFYSVVDTLTAASFAITGRMRFANIIPAATYYDEHTGCWGEQ